MVPLFGCNYTKICKIFNEVLDYQDYHRIQLRSSIFLQLYLLRDYADAENQKGTPLNNYYGLVDGTLICCGNLNQRQVHNDHKSVMAKRFKV